MMCVNCDRKEATERYSLCCECYFKPDVHRRYRIASTQTIETDYLVVEHPGGDRPHPLAVLGYDPEDYTQCSTSIFIHNNKAYEARAGYLSTAEIAEMVDRLKRRLAVHSCQALADGRWRLTYVVLADSYTLDPWDWVYDI